MAAISCGIVDGEARLDLDYIEDSSAEVDANVVMTGDGLVTGFVKRGQTAAGSYHFIGVQVAEASVFAGLKDGEPIDSLFGVYAPLIASAPGSIRGHVCDAAFWDIGTPEDYAATDAAFKT